MIGRAVPAPLPPRRIALAAVLLLAAGVGLGWSFGGAPPPGAARPEADRWTLPADKPPQPASDVALLKERHPWGGSAASDSSRATAGQSAESWRLAGIVMRGDERFALLASGPAAAPRLEYRRLGDPFPDGSRLVELTADSAVTEDAAMPSPVRHTYRLFRKK
jgi:hypothetical protein